MSTDPAGKSFTEEIELSFSNSIKSQEPFIAVDYGFSLLYMNKAAEKLFRKDTKKVLGEPFEKVFPLEWVLPAFKTARKNLSAKAVSDVKYNSPSTNQWVHLIGRPFENYYALTFRVFDYKEMLKSELRQQVKKK